MQGVLHVASSTLGVPDPSKAPGRRAKGLQWRMGRLYPARSWHPLSTGPEGVDLPRCWLESITPRATGTRCPLGLSTLLGAPCHEISTPGLTAGGGGSPQGLGKRQS